MSSVKAPLLQYILKKKKNNKYVGKKKKKGETRKYIAEEKYRKIK